MAIPPLFYPVSDSYQVPPMVWRILGKLLFRTTVSLVLVLGVLSYGHYLRGGDPGSLWKNIAGNGAQRFVGVLNGSLDGLKRGADASVAALRSGVRSSEAAGKAVIFTWQDADGITHFSQTAPSGVTSRTVTIDPNVNVLAPVRAPSIGETETPGAASSARAADVIADDLRDLRAIGSLPGVAEQF